MDLTDNEISALRAIYSLETPTRIAISRECSMSLGVTSSVLGALLGKGAIGKIDKYTPTMGHPSAVFGIDAAFGFPWRLPASALVLATTLAWLVELARPEEDGPADKIAN